MANSATVYARIDPKLKREVEDILFALGMTPSSLIQMLYSEIKLTKKVPLTLAIPNNRPVFMEKCTREEIDAELQKGMDDAKEGRIFTLDELDAVLKKDMGV